MNENEYTKHMTSDFIVAKRGYCYFLYTSAELAFADDAEVSRNIERLNSNEPIFNRCYDGHWVAYTRKFRNLKQFLAELANFPEDLAAAKNGWQFGYLG